MQLAYQSQRQHNLSQQLSQLDKMYKSIQMSVKDITASSLSKQAKTKILKMIQRDSAFKLSRYLKKQAIAFDSQVGTLGSQWNILHICVKHDSMQCLQCILKTQYQQDPQGYFELINTKTVQGYSPIVIAIINKSNKCLQKLLHFGGLDIHTVDAYKMTPYEISINYKNEKAIKMLMNYQNKSKKKKYINIIALSEPIILRYEQSCFDSFIGCLLSCLSLGMYRKQQDSTNKNPLHSKFSSLVTNIKPQQIVIDYVQISSKNDIDGYDIQWKRAEQVLSSRGISLFNSFNPFGIIQNNFVISNNLIIFQCISQHSWLVRKLISPDKLKHNLYNIHIYPNQNSQKITTDDYIPFIKQRHQPMFFCDKGQLWPMLLQKGLAKYHQSYLSLANIHPKSLLEQLTGYYTFTINIEETPNITQLLKQFGQKGYLHILTGRLNSELCDQSGKQECFTVLNFFQKDKKDFVLINCPFVLDSWKQKQKFELLAMKLVKSHYNNHNQMCVWIEAQNICKYFSKLIVSYTLPNYQRSELKMTANKYVFFKFKIDQMRKDQIIIALYDVHTMQPYKLESLEGWKNQGNQKIKKKSCKNYLTDLAHIYHQPGQYMCKYQLEENIESHLHLICWSVDYIQIQYVQEEFAIVQWLEMCKQNAKIKWNQQSPLYYAQKVGQINLVMYRSTKQETKKVYLELNIPVETIIEGKFQQGKGIELIEQNNFFYGVFKYEINLQKLQFSIQ